MVEVIYVKNPTDVIDLDPALPFITIDYAIGSPTPGAWYNGWRSKGGKLIEDVGFKKKVIEAIKSDIENKQRIVTQIGEV